MELEHEAQVWMKMYEEVLRLLEKNCCLKGKEMARTENRELEDRIPKLVEEDFSSCIERRKGGQERKR